MTNAQSLGNRYEDIEVVFEQNNVDVGVVTESWFSDDMPEDQLNISNYNLFSQPRKKHGGEAIYVKEDIYLHPYGKHSRPTYARMFMVKN